MVKSIGRLQEWHDDMVIPDEQIRIKGVC